MLVFPEGIRLARANEIPNSPEKSESVEKIRNAQIEQGYVSQTASEPLFTCYAEANVDAPQIWQVFRSLCEALLPEEAMPIIGEIDEEPLHNGNYDQTQKLLALFERFNYYLTNDCNIQFGLASETDTELTEVFVTPTKHFQIWTSKANILANVMKKYGIAESDELQFIDEFPRVTTGLKYKNEFQDYDDLINYLVEETEGKRRFLITKQANNSMDVRAKQRLSYRSFPFNSNGLGGGFAPRHLKRWTFPKGNLKR